MYEKISPSKISLIAQIARFQIIQDQTAFSQELWQTEEQIVKSATRLTTTVNRQLANMIRIATARIFKAAGLVFYWLLLVDFFYKTLSKKLEFF